MLRQGFLTSETAPPKATEWYVSDGARVVGPVATQKLLVHAARGAIDPSHVVCERTWGFWKPLREVREFRAMKEAQAARGGAWIPPPAWSPRHAERVRIARALSPLDVASDRDEVLHLALTAAAKSTGATVGLVHKPRGVAGPLDTRAAIGEAIHNRLGERVASIDPAMFAARSLGPIVIPVPETSRAGIASTLRLSRGYAPLRGVALFPIYANRQLAAIVELGKEHHGFRAADIQTLKSVANFAADRLNRYAS
jgi:hypothetical protein